MRQLTYLKPGALRWDEVPEPSLKDSTSALVRPFVVARCDLDAVFLRHNVARTLRLGRLLHQVDPSVADTVGTDYLRGPFPMGHECVAEVLEVGADVHGFSRGDRVVVPFQISCGTCPMCTRSLTSQCETHGSFDMFGGIGRDTARGGMLSDVVLVPQAQRMLIPVPASLDPLDLASASDNLPDAWSRVAPELLGSPGKDVLVLGGSARSISLYCVAFAVAMQASRVDYSDRNSERCAIASNLGATIVEAPVAATSRRYDLVVNGSSRRSAIAESIRCLRPGGVCTSMSIYFNKSVPVPFFQLYAKNLTLKTGLANPMADIPPMLQFIEEHRVDVGAVTSRLAEWNQAPEALLDDTTKVVIHRPPMFRREL
ncbi:MAG: alcohol dehydrogenase catalytic domain-containing protein [Thermoanaerobaculia bacterium]|nr:alcohol dehydrogenase catalytic domain-containing protein [Thermoanaerobaculia bacterium]